MKKNFLVIVGLVAAAVLALGGTARGDGTVKRATATWGTVCQPGFDTSLFDSWSTTIPSLTNLWCTNALPCEYGSGNTTGDFSSWLFDFGGNGSFGGWSGWANGETGPMTPTPKPSTGLLALLGFGLIGVSLAFHRSRA